MAAPAAAGPCGALGPFSICTEAGTQCILLAAGPDGVVTRLQVALPHPETCSLIGNTAMSVVEVCPGLPAALPATLIASVVPLADFGETAGGGFTHRQAEALVLVDATGALRIGEVSKGAASRDARVHAPDPKHLQIAAHAQGFCAPGG